ncbi:MAG TPA: AAA family ATPase, partial [Streptosporangiaceae bacterium]
GQGALCWFQGEPGIGKSALTSALLDGAAGLGVTIFRGAASERVMAFPLRPLTDGLRIGPQATDPARAEIAELLHGTAGRARMVDPVLAASERMMELVDRWCADGPVALAVEDLHWADEASLLAWNRLARAVGQIPLLLIGSARPTPRRPTVGRLRELAAERGVVLDLGPLEPAGVTELAAGVAGGVPGPRLRTALTRAGGNPLYLMELTAGLTRGGELNVSDGVAELRRDVTALPGSLTAAIRRRLGQLDRPTRAALRIAALMGNEFDAAEWSAATGRSVIEVAAMVDTAAADGVLSGGGERLRFRHELIRQVLAAEVAAADRCAVHARIARDLARADCGVHAVARHLLAVPGPVPDWVPAWLAGIGEPALYTLPQVSAELLSRALAAAGDEHPQWETLTAQLARVLFWIGRDDQASELAGQVAGRTSDPVLAARMRIQLIRSAGRTRRPAQALAVTTGTVADPRLPADWQARLAAWSALLRRAAGQVTEAAELAAAALAAAAESGDPLAVATARHAAAMCGSAAGRPGHIEAALAVLRGRDPESTDLRLILLANRIAVAAECGLTDQAEAALREGLRLAERAGTVRGADMLAAAAQFSYRYGRWDDALAQLAGADQEGSGTDPSGSSRGIAALIALRRGDRESADAQLASIAGRPAGLVPLPERSYPLIEAQALRAEADGDLDRAVAVMSGWLPASAGLPATERDDGLPYLVYLALAAGQNATARTAAALSKAGAAAGGSPGRAAAARFCQALLAHDSRELLAVADGYEQLGWIPRQAFALEEAAVRLAGNGEVTAARAALTRAVRIYSGLGAAWDAGRADRRLKQHGVRRGPNSIRRGPSHGWDALTPSERRVAEL